MNASAAPAQAVTRRVLVVQGEYRVSDDPQVALHTILGSCVAACLNDPVAKIGGMNHFLLPGVEGEGREGLRYGVNAMELLINDLLQRGARRDRLQGKLFGGARMLSGLTDIGRQNSVFAENFLRSENIPCVSASLGGDEARRVQYWPVGGRARMLFVRRDEASTLFAQERVTPAPARPDDGSVELF